MAEHGLHVVRFFVSACVMLQPFATARPPAGVWAGHGSRVPQYRRGPLSAAADCAAAKKYNLYGYGEEKVAKDVSRMRQCAARAVDVLPFVRHADRGGLSSSAVVPSVG